ncbi:CRISPR-associated endonuclease Cas1 [Accumulibacter sp.]|uniref:CRISPR-associated endonuclease Cas1 n=1 Tax=Accumulibacter sp. TaxID=2053492 RepID=UPI0026213479|nr:CRISPR-associated endonuclease Cas1 [Accumulibacter sp.]
MSRVLYIDRHGVKVGASQGRLTLKTPDQQDQSVPLQQLEQVIVLAHAHFSHDAISSLLREGIPVVFSGLRGGFRGTLSGQAGRQVMRRKRQFQAMDDPAGRLTIARALVQAKIRGHGRLLRQWRLPAQHEIAAGLLASHHCRDLDSLRGHEGAAARAFFDGLRQHLEASPFRFEQRRQHPPPDPVNSVLSLTYTLLLNEVEVGVAAAGLDAAAGFYHSADNGRPTLLMDLVEPLRPLADRLSGRLLKAELSPDDFEIDGDCCHLRDGRRGIVYKAWEHLLAGSVVWRRENTSWRRLIHLQARELAHWLDGSITAPRFWHLDDA